MRRSVEWRVMILAGVVLTDAKVLKVLRGRKENERLLEVCRRVEEVDGGFVTGLVQAVSRRGVTERGKRNIGSSKLCADEEV